jgi:nitroimidazol reductase NimA-like FMN-containing flavoprotein (pyridoxamine 5'-phosphate oxidase superfamily)
MDLSMTPGERLTFLTDAPRVGVLSVESPDRGPVSAPVWYTLEGDNRISFSVGDASRKALLLRAANQATLCVQSEEAPYRYVSVEGAVTDLGASADASRRERAIRYLGPEFGEAYFASTRDEVESTFALRPRRWASIDYNKLFG